MHAMVPVLVGAGVALVATSIVIVMARAHVARAAGLGAALALLASSGALAVQPALAASPPPFTFSRYVGTLSMYTMGCNQGRAADALGQPDELAILDFGDPGWNSAGTFGAWDNLLGGFVTIPQIETGVETYMQGFWDCTVPGSHSFMNVAPGVTNHGGAGTAAHGQAWAHMVKDLNAWITSHSFGSQLFALGAADLEPSWAPPADTEAWANGFNLVGGNYYDFGSADGCPPFGSCNNGWSQADEYAVAWGIPAAFAVPEIFTESGSMATQWQQISLWGANHGSAGAIHFSAAMSQFQACADVGDPCSGTDNTPAQAWSQLTSSINSDPKTAGSVFFSTEVSRQTT
jgi:hypothetical protein